MRKMIHRFTGDNSQRGFTIVELLIASLVFSTILLLATIGIIQVSHTYYKGINETNTQDTARSVLESIGQAIQFGGGTITALATPEQPGTMKAFCVGDQQFSYNLGTQLVTGAPGPGQTNAVLRSNTVPNCNASSPPLTTGPELLAQNMRLAELTVAPIPGGLAYNIHVKVVYGDSNLLSNPTTPAALCKSGVGSQFCSVSDISTIVYKRVQ